MVMFGEICKEHKGQNSLCLQAERLKQDDTRWQKNGKKKERKTEQNVPGLATMNELSFCCAAQHFRRRCDMSTALERDLALFFHYVTETIFNFKTLCSLLPLIGMIQSY